MSEERFEVKEHHGLPMMFDNKERVFYTKLLAHKTVLKEFCRIANNLDRKSKCCNKKMEVMLKFMDMDSFNQFVEENGLGGCE